jgi:protein-tyrosine phosphatase
VRPPLVDVHSHVVPSGDDGAQTPADGIALCRAAAEWGTGILFATPHVWPNLPLGADRERRVREAFARMAPLAGLELRLGFELTPSRALLREDLRRYELEGTGAVLMEVPFVGPADELFELAGRAEAAGLQPVIAHPERSEAVQLEPGLVDELAGRGWLIQVNGTSLLGRHGETAAEIGWDVLERDVASLVGSDGHRMTRPARIDDAYAAAVERLGPEAVRFFDGSALGLAAAGSTSARTPSRAASRGA